MSKWMKVTKEITQKQWICLQQMQQFLQLNSLTSTLPKQATKSPKQVHKWWKKKKDPILYFESNFGRNGGTNKCEVTFDRDVGKNKLYYQSWKASQKAHSWPQKFTNGGKRPFLKTEQTEARNQVGWSSDTRELQKARISRHLQHSASVVGGDLR